MSPWFVALLAGPAVLIPLAAYAVSRRQVKGARWYALLLVTIAWWSVTYAWELAAQDFGTKVLALKIKYVAVAALPPAWVGFILEFVGSTPARVRTRVLPFSLVAGVVLLVVWTDSWHGLFWGHMALRSIDRYLVLQGRGPGFFLNVGYTYVVLAFGLVLLLLHTVHSPYLYRKRTVVLMAGTIVPWVGNFVFLLQRDEAILDPTPFLFTCTAVIAALAVFRYDLLEPVPTLKDARIESVGDAVIILDRRRRIADVNAAAETLLGRRRAEAAGTSVDEVMPNWVEGTPPGEPFDLTLGAGAQARIFDVRWNAVQSRAGHEVGAVVVLRDVTERRAAEAALRESEARYRAVIEQAFDGVWLTDWTDMILDVNPQACELLDSSSDQLIGHPTSECARAIDAPFSLDARSLRRGDPVAWEREVETRSGRRMWLAGRSKLIAANLIVSTFRDITEERQHALLRERLLDEAQTSNRLKDEFLATLSHEMRTPLNAVVGWAQMLARQQVEGAKVPHALSVIERNALAQARLLEDLLDLSGLARGRTRLTLRPTRIQDVVRDALDDVGQSATAKGLSLDVSVPDDLPPIEADPDRMRQVIWNLLANAIKFTGPGGRITLTAAVVGSEVRVVVEDTGSGIPPEFLPHVFEPFRQADPLRSGPRGLGLGLSIVRHIVEAHGGRVEAESAGRERGSTFTVHLPLLVPQAAGERLS